MNWRAELDKPAAVRRRLARRIFVTCWVVYTLHWTPYIVREHFPAITLAEDLTLDVEQFLGWSETVFRGPLDGAYINNNPGASFLGALPLILVRPALDSVRTWNERHPRRHIADTLPLVTRLAVSERCEAYHLAVAFATVAGLMAPVTALTASVLVLTLLSAGVPTRLVLGAALVYAFGTPVFLRTGYLSHNLLVSHSAMLGFVLLLTAYGGRAGIDRATIRHTYAAGLLAGFAVLCDYSGLVVLAVLTGYALLRISAQPSHTRMSLVRAYVAGVLPGLIALAAYQQLAFGHPVWPAQHYMPADITFDRGYRGFGAPALSVVWANFFDLHFGLFVYCPLLVLGLIAPFVRGGRYRVPPRETAVILSFFGLFVLFCSANSYSVLQPSTGFRYLVPVVPGLLILSLQVVQAAPRWIRILVVTVTIAQSWALAITHATPGAFLNGSAVYSFAWLHRIRELGGPDIAGPATLCLALISVVWVMLMWREEIRPFQIARLVE